MSNPNFFNWSQEEKDRYASQKLIEMRKMNDEIQKRHLLVQDDQRAAENKNSSVTNSTKRQNYASEMPSQDRSKQERSRPSRDVPRYSREWDRGKSNDDWEQHSPKAFKSYSRSNFERRNFENESSKNERNYRNDHGFEKHTKHYNKDHRNRSQFHDSSSKQSWYQSSESSKKLQQSRDKSKRYFSADATKHNKCQSNSSSTDSDCVIIKWNKPRSFNTETSALWHSDRLKEDKNKRERTLEWLESVQGCSLEQENISAQEEKTIISPKIKLNKSESAYNESSNDNDTHTIIRPYIVFSSKNKPKQSCSLKSRKLDCASITSNTKDDKIKEQKRHSPRKSYTKFDRYNRSDHSSDDSESCGNLESSKTNYVSKDNSDIKDTVAKCNFKPENFCSSDNKDPCDSGKHNYIQYKNESPEKIHSKCNMKLENVRSEKNEEPSNSDKKPTVYKSASKSSSYHLESQFKRSSDNQSYNSAKNVHSNNEKYSGSRQFTYSDNRFDQKDLKKGSKTKRNPDTNPQYDSPESCKNEHYSKQRKFNQGQYNESWNTSGNKNREKIEKGTSNTKKSFKVQSKNQDDGWAYRSQAQDEDSWAHRSQSQDDDREGIWASADQSDIKWELNEENIDTSMKNIKCSVIHNEKEAKSFKVRNPTASDDGGWSTVEEGEIISDDDLGESKEHVK